jgi:fructose transport system substrate-binding protein
LFAAAAFGALAAAPAQAASHSVGACLITKTDTNPFFVKMKEGAEAKAAELGVSLKSYAGKIDGDHETQVAAIETCIADGAKGILLTASDTSSIVSAVQQARDAGLLVIALDTPLDPIDAADATFATDNFLAGELIGKWAAATLGDEAANAKIGMLDLAVSQPTVGVLRDQGFLTGFGIDVKDPSKWGDEEDPRIVGNDVTAGNEEGGRRAMENLLAKDPMINVVYTINEPAAAGAYEALKAIGREGDVLIVSVDGGCPGVAERQGRRHRRDLAAVSAADGLLGHRSDRRMGQGRHQAGADRRQELLRYRCGACHRQAGRRRRVDLGRRRHGQVLGLITASDR